MLIASNKHMVEQYNINIMCGVPSSLFDWCNLSLKVGVVYADEDGWGGHVQLGDHLRRQKQL